MDSEAARILPFPVHKSPSNQEYSECCIILMGFRSNFSNFRLKQRLEYIITVAMGAHKYNISQILSHS